jgi:hypothetical protein
MDGVLDAYRAEKLGSARLVLAAHCQQLTQQAGSSAKAKAAIKKALCLRNPQAVTLPDLDSTNQIPEGLNRAHLQWAMWAAARIFCREVLGIQ